MMENLFAAQAADGQSAEVDWSGGFGSFVGWGTFEGTTLKLQMSPDGGTTWIDVGTDVTLTAAGIANFQLNPCKLRSDLSGTGSPSPSVSAQIRQMPATFRTAFPAAGSAAYPWRPGYRGGSSGGDPSLTFWHDFVEGHLNGKKGPLVSHTRDTISGLGIDAAGVGFSVASGQGPVFDHDPDNDNEPLGFQMNEARSNIMLHNRDWTDAVYDTVTNITALKDATGLKGVANSASTLTATAANGVIRQSITVTSAARTYQVHVRRKTGTGTIELTDNGGTNYTDITSDLNSSTYSLVYITRTQADPDVGFRIVTDGDEIEVDYGQVVALAVPTPPVETGAASVTVDAEDASVSDVSWYNAAAATLFVKMRPGPGIVANNQYRTILSLDDGGTNNRIEIANGSGTTGKIRCTVASGGSTVANFLGTGADLVEGQFSKYAVTAKADLFRGFANGSQFGSDDTGGAMPVGVSVLVIGDRSSSVAIWNGWITEIQGFTVDKSIAFCEVLTT